jgi:tetratricopeptide (TPR) repeat protein
MEERIIDEEYGRGVRLRKTKDGYVDVTDELVDGEIPDEEAGDEIAFEFPNFDEFGDKDDEDLVDLSPEEAARVRKEKAEAAQRRYEEYEAACKEGERLLAEEKYDEAEEVYEKALNLDEIATEASVGYWRAKTMNFGDPYYLFVEYADTGIEEMEHDLGTEALEIIKKEHRPQFEAQLQLLQKSEAPLAKEFEEKQDARREVLSARKLRWGIAFILCTIPALVAIIATVVVGLRNFGAPDDRYLVPTIILGAVALVLFVAFMIITNKYINAGRMYRDNERLSTTNEGRSLAMLRDHIELCQLLLEPSDEANQDE